jgi:undecaprenyl-diphosphatase
VLLPALIGGSWASSLNVSAPNSPYLAFIVGLHVATAIAMIAFFWRDWLRIVRGFFTSLRTRSITTPDERLAWMIILATIPVGIVGVVFEHTFRVLFARPILAGIFLMVNGLILLAGERYRTRASLAADAAVAAARAPGRAAELADARQADLRLASMGYPKAVIIGSAQVFALLAGISRDGVTIVAGLRRGLSREDAARFAFLLATPVILAAGALKIPDLLGPLGNGIRGQILLGSVLSGIGAYLSVRFLLRYLRTRTLTPFGFYCLIAGLASVVYLGLVR